jgi:putative nucleotidyltransferase with HDIG domain
MRVLPRPQSRTPGDDRWSARPLLAFVVRCCIVTVPVAASLAATMAARLVFPLPGPAGARAVWCLGMLGVAVLTVVGTERAVRKALPLATLLRMAMLFPDRAPSRFQVARRAWNARRLRELADEALADGACERSAAQAAASVLALVTALSAHDRRTRGHAERVRIFTDMLAEEFKLPEDERDRLRWAALLHDIGKLTVTSGILNKPGRLDAAEWAVMSAHPMEGARIAEPLMVWLGSWGRTIAEHHERFDGTGYPMGRSGDAISVGARLVSVADAYDTMTAARSYKRPMATRRAREELARWSGTQFDPVMVRAFLSISVPRLVWVSGPASFLLHIPYFWELQRAGGQAAGVVAQATAVGVVATAAAVTLAGPLATATHHAGMVAQGAGATVTQVSPPGAVPGGGSDVGPTGAGRSHGDGGGHGPAPGPGPGPGPSEPRSGGGDGLLGGLSQKLPLPLPSQPVSLPTNLPPLPLPTPTKLPLPLPTKPPLDLSQPDPSPSDEGA